MSSDLSESFRHNVERALAEREGVSDSVRREAILLLASCFQKCAVGISDAERSRAVTEVLLVPRFIELFEGDEDVGVDSVFVLCKN